MHTIRPLGAVILITLPIDLGCRVATAFRAIADQGEVSAGQWVAVHGCGGVGLSAIMIAGALGAYVIAIDINDQKLEFARSVGATEIVNATSREDVVAAVRETTGGGAHVSLDALGSPATSFNSVSCLRKRGRHIQVGLMLGDHSRPSVPMDKVIANELQILGSHGMQAHRYPALMATIQAGKIAPDKLIGKTVSLEESLNELTAMDNFTGTGVTVVDRFR